MQVFPLAGQEDLPFLGLKPQNLQSTTASASTFLLECLAESNCRVDASSRSVTVNNIILLSVHLPRLGLERTKGLQIWTALPSVSGFSRNSTWRSLVDTEK